VAKNKSLKKDNELLDIDFIRELSSPDDDSIAKMMVGLVDASNHLQKIAIELTKLVVERSTENMDEEKVFSAFTRASKVTIDNFPFEKLWEKFS
jgi:hypothetical protein